MKIGGIYMFKSMKQAQIAPPPDKSTLDFSGYFLEIFRGRKNGFTLAEVLITLGIIGVVAALTIPSLVVKHKKQVVVTKLKKASAALMQAYNMSKLDYGDALREIFPALDGDAALEMFNKYYVPYMKFTKVEKGEKGVFGYLADGTVLYFFKSRETTEPTNPWTCTYFAVCMDIKSCKNIEATVSSTNSGIADGKNILGLYINGRIPDWYFKTTADRDTKINNCKQQNIEACSALIFEAGWQIPDDYPIKF